QREALAGPQLEVDPVHRAHGSGGRMKGGSQVSDLEGRTADFAHHDGIGKNRVRRRILRVHAGTKPMRTRGSKPSRTASATRFAASTRANMKKKAAARDHHTTGSRPISRRAPLIMVPKLVVAGSTPTPTYDSTASARTNPEKSITVA